MYKDKKIAILGWGEDTRDVVPWLTEQGAVVDVFDKNKNLDRSFAQINDWKLGGELFDGLENYDFLVRSPGIYRYRADIVAAEEKGAKVTSKTKIFFDVCPSKIIGVTGTKGKGTTSTLIYEILKSAGKDVYIGGNIGKGMFEFLYKLKSDSLVVLELSSFQLIDLHKSPYIAVVVMTTSDHLDWHKDINEYWQAKSNLTQHQGASDFCVINSLYEGSRWIGNKSPGVKYFVEPDYFKGEIRMKGLHQKQNVSVALKVGEILEIDLKVIQKVASEFRGLEHRLEEVGTVGGVTFFDDSISTVPETAISATRSFDCPLTLILGGSDKGSDFGQLGQEIKNNKKIKNVILVGDTAAKIKAAIGDNSEIDIFEDITQMREMVDKAFEVSKPGYAVILSPACASFGLFRDYKDRGNQFKSRVLELLEQK